MSIASDIAEIQRKLASERNVYDNHCREVAKVILPRQEQFFRETTMEGDKRNERIIDSMPMRALEKFAAAMESILTPRASKWHGLTTNNEELNKNQEVSEYYDAVTNILFQKRYATTANYASQQHEAYMGLGAFGTSVMMTEDDAETRGVRYKNSHISEHFFMENARNIIDTNYRLYRITARQAVQRFTMDKLPETVQRAAEKTPTDKFEFIHCVRPNEERTPSSADFRSFKFSSFHVFPAENHLISEGGFRTFPYHISRYVTAPNEKYGRSPGMTALGEIKMLNAMRRSDLRARHMAIDPPVLTTSERGIRRPLIKPGAVNYGALDESGQPLLKPYNNISRVDVSKDAMSNSHEIVNDIFLVTLFQILVDSPQMTATEVLQRAQEKGALLSPTAGRQQSEALGPMIEREIDLLSFSGALPPMPDILLEAGGEFEIEYTAPLNVMQRAGEAISATQMINDIIPLAQFKPEIVNKINFDGYVEVLRDARGAPAKMFNSEEEELALTQGDKQAQQLQSLVEAAPGVAGAVKDIAQAEALGV